MINMHRSQECEVLREIFHDFARDLALDDKNREGQRDNLNTAPRSAVRVSRLAMV